MAIRQLRIGSMVDIQQYDDADFDSAIETDQPIKAGTPVDPTDVVRLMDLVGSILTPLAVANIDIPTELNTKAGTVGAIILVYQAAGATVIDQYTIYAYDASGPAVSAPYIMDAVGAGAERWIAIAGKYIYASTTINGSLGLGVAPTAKLSINGGAHVGGSTDPGDNNLLVDGKLGVAVAPTALLHLAAGSAVATTAPLKFDPGVLLAVPEAGVMEFDGTGVYLTPTNHRRFISLASDSIIASVTATTVASTTLWTGITNANELKAHRVYVIKACGLYTTDAVDTATISLYMGATLIGLITTPVGAIADGPWYLEIFLTVRTIGVLGTISAFGRFDASTGSAYGTLESFVLDTTAANNLTIACTWSAVGNSLKLTQCWLATAD